jgi:DNA modification methylase
MSTTVLTGDCRQLLATLADGSVHSCVTSPPYYGLRDYGVDGQMGLEGSPDEFVAGMVAVFREVRRVLRDDGTLWLNIGDSYANGGRTSRDLDEKLPDRQNAPRLPDPLGVKPKDLIGIPWMLAFALRADGWFLRQDIIWSKPNPMPESVTDRCTKAHEYLFLLSKGPRYHFDSAAIAEPSVKGDNGSTFTAGKTADHQMGRATGRSGNKARKPGSERGCPEGTGSNVCGSIPWEGSSRNKRSVWTVATQPFKEAHFATFPPSLIEPCILAGCPAGGTVLDPFGGAGTTALVAQNLGRNAILIELNPEYAAMAERRVIGRNLGLPLGAAA